MSSGEREVVEVRGGGHHWHRASDYGDEPELWLGEGGMGSSITVTISRLPVDKDDFVQACEAAERYACVVVPLKEHERIVAWLNGDGQGWPPRGWQPGMAILRPGVRNFQGPGSNER
jgi:hypothetical protein